MTVRVTCDGGAIDEFSRFADRYIKHDDGSLEIVRLGAPKTTSYDAGCWTEVTGDEHQTRRARFRHWFTRTAVAGA
ncbi:hypothetical protein [Mycolicibacterium llatzerense]|uniref:hypothetical protein n=1 Tax=Mycolicibacterium llatzerense TaxID=280871 RepID=UPI0021B5F122|nr:hypothetical protein [Mycolicibacterium llatzerense]MCT7365795.1 hypothetical protein [Mycolicibacterium llatzerense]